MLGISAGKKGRLIAGGIPLRQFTTIGYGEARPVANNETADGRAKNRRIDVIIVPPADG